MRLLTWGGRLVALLLVVAMGHAVPARAELKLCGHEWANPDVLQKKFEGDEKYKEIHRDKHYLAFQNESDYTVWTFTLPGIPAHPAVVCRRPKFEGEYFTLEMEFNCLGDPRACDGLVQDFRRYNSQIAESMKEQLNKKK